MRLDRKNLAVAALALVAVPASTVTFAASSGRQIEEVIVTATKRAENIYEVPFAVSAFEGDKLAQQGIVDIVDVGKFVPNLNITQFSAGHISSANPFIRGIGLQDHLITTDPGVSVYVDGVYLGRQVGQNWSLTNIERIEVLRGPQGTLYGRNSIGGAINCIESVNCKHAMLLEVRKLQQDLERGLSGGFITVSCKHLGSNDADRGVRVLQELRE